MSAPPKFPGSRWWKVDFHTHTPASLCQRTEGWRNARGTPDEVTPEVWIAKFMSAEIDCVVVTDHNTGEWIDQLKKAYEQKRDNLDEGFRVHATKDTGRRDIPQYHRHAPP